MAEREDFYNFLAQDYDRMTRFEERLGRERELLRRFLAAAKLRTGLDLGCGTGLHTIALAQLGLQMTGVDLSPEMIARARENARKHGQEHIRWHIAALENFLSVAPGPFDLIVCLGNTLAHVSPDQIPGVFDSFHRALNPGGLVLLQLLNYGLILQQRQRIVDARRVEKDIFVRFYDFLPDRLRFNLLILEENGSGFRHSLRSTELFPHRAGTLTAALEAAGFGTVSSFGDLAQSPFEPQASKNLVVRAVRR